MSEFDRAMEAEARRQDEATQYNARTAHAADKAAQAQIDGFVDAMLKRHIPTDRTFSTARGPVKAWRLTYCDFHKHGSAISEARELIEFSHGSGTALPPSMLGVKLSATYQEVELPAVALRLVQGRGPITYDCI